MTTEELLANIRVIEDFPIKGIHFQDITTLFANPECIKEVTDRLVSLYKDKGITKVVGLESRGFVFGAILAEKLGAGFVPARKKGKLPGETLSETYNLEYGFDCIEIHVGAINKDDVVLIHDDLLATGGTLGASIRLVKQFNPKKIYINTIIDLTACPRSTAYPQDIERTSILEIDVA
ncbi:MAG: adenine phosphoribosyltransferase [Bacteroidales bacterium]|nr:adenine phosphoribosyltransferase [Bacteroidales bacterium]